MKRLAVTLLLCGLFSAPALADDAQLWRFKKGIHLANGDSFEAPSGLLFGRLKNGCQFYAHELIRQINCNRRVRELDGQAYLLMVQARAYLNYSAACKPQCNLRVRVLRARVVRSKRVVLWLAQRLLKRYPAVHLFVIDARLHAI